MWFIQMLFHSLRQ